MKIFISADIEGVSLTNNRNDCIPGERGFAQSAELMTREVAAACLGAIAAGAKEITVKDGHGDGCNIDVAQMPPNVRVLRGWSGDPNLMVEGIDSTYTAALFVGHHNAAAAEGNPLAHTISGGSVAAITLNGAPASEFMLYSYACAYVSVPVVFLSGDKGLIEASQGLHPLLRTVATKEGRGGLTECYPVEQAITDIQAEAERALKQKLADGRIALPPSFDLVITHRSHHTTSAKSYYPGVKRLSANTLQFSTTDYYEVLRALRFIL